MTYVSPLVSDDTNAIVPAKTVNKACKVHAVGQLLSMLGRT